MNFQQLAIDETPLQFLVPVLSGLGPQVGGGGGTGNARMMCCAMCYTRFNNRKSLDAAQGDSQGIPLLKVFQEDN